MSNKAVEWERRGDCIVITSHTPTPAGYFDIRKNNRRALAHRVVCERRYGPLGDLKALHSCDNPACINPAHLRAGTQAENVADMHARHRNNSPPPPIHHGESHWASKLNPQAVADIFASVEKQQTLAERYHVNQSVISRIESRKAWRAAL